MQRKVDIKWLNTMLVNKRISLESIIIELVFILLRITEIQEYKDGKPTGVVSGFAYEVVDTVNYDHYIFKVEQATPLMSNEELQERREAGEKFFVEFINGTVMAYVSQKNSLEDSFKADDVRFVETSL